MLDMLRRRKRMVLGFLGSAAGMAAAYWWYSGYTTTKLLQQRSVEAELTAILRGASLADEGGEEGAGDDCGSPDSLDETLDSHFTYIQQVSAPQELASLIPRIQAKLQALTDVSLVKQLHAQRLAAAQAAAVAEGCDEAAAAAAAAAGGAQAQLRLLAQLCFGRTVAAAFLLPLADLAVRAKLNIIGRHLFLQEKFSSLRQPSAPAQRMRLPPRLTAGAAESFLACEHLAERGVEWLVEQAMHVTDQLLGDTPLDVSVTPEELAGLVQSMASALGTAVASASASTPGGCAWADIVLGPASAAAALAAAAAGAANGPVDVLGGGGSAGGAANGAPLLPPGAAAGSAGSYRRALASAAMVEEMEGELRRVLCNYRFGEALHAAVGQCLSTCAAHIHATFISQAAAAALQQHQQQQQQQQQQAATASPPPASPPPASPTPSSSSAPALAAEQLPSATSPSSSAPAHAASAPAEVSPAPPAHVRLASPFSTAAGDDAAASSSAPAASERPSGSRQPSPASSATPPPRASISGAARASSLAAAALAAMAPKPLARCLRQVQGACEPLWVDAREVTERIAALPAVMSMCAVAFAAPLELR